MSNDRKTVWVCLMLRNVKVKSWPGSLHITDRNTCLGSRNPTKQNVLFFFSFSLLPLEVTFTLAANETKQRRVIKADVFIQGFYRKLISWGMQSCARLIGGKLTFLKGKQAASVKSYRICIYIHGLRCVRHKSFDSNSSHHRFFLFFLFKHWKKRGCGLTQWTTRWVNEPSQAICPAVTVTLTLKKQHWLIGAFRDSLLHVSAEKPDTTKHVIREKHMQKTYLFWNVFSAMCP